MNAPVSMKIIGYLLFIEIAVVIFGKVERGVTFIDSVIRK